MGLLPEFFLLLGIVVFLALSLLCALLDDDLPSRLPYLFQGGAIAGLGALLISQGFINSGIFGRSSTDSGRFWISVVYLALAVSSVVGLNVYIAVARRKMALASTFSGAVTVPTFMISAILISSFLGTLILAGSALAISLSVFLFLRGTFNHTRKAPGGQGSSSTILASLPLEVPEISLQSHLPSINGQEEWEEPPMKKSEE